MAHNHNPSGKNQYDFVPKASDARLAEALQRYHKEFITNPVVIKELLAAEPEPIHMSVQTIQHRRKELGLVGSHTTAKKMHSTRETQLVLDQMGKDPNMRRGVRLTHAKIAMETGVHLRQEHVREIMQQFELEGFEKREPCGKKIRRHPIISVGPGAEWSGDGHDKLKKIGFSIYGIRDIAPGKWLKLKLLPDNRLKETIAYVYLELVEELGGMYLAPQVQLMTDHGSETTLMCAYGHTLREFFYPELNSDELPVHHFTSSTCNIVIERGWLRLCEDFGDNMVLVFRQGEQEGIYNPENLVHYALCRWLWSFFLTQELDKWRLEQNAFRVRKLNNKVGPSGVSANIAYALPGKFGMRNVLLQDIDVKIVHHMKGELSSDSLQFVPPEYAESAKKIYDSLNVHELSIHNVWVIFRKMLSMM
ncbi:uncharacterized protein EI90DRAFT_2959957 [Cantharellus anzutake]|uniref:uncharacterized protein n=1 Tax=Cantharellus anzutake TaxID=1750568 RepID=UPI001908994B|nr:uncharacterized protein EI90DRAFT_2959957 [Cantharellus anzutake]KAF8308853.1 hypothetical protein EI90DRAFT_2959957 [Cantharellus anzutake]